MRDAVNRANQTNNLKNVNTFTDNFGLTWRS